MLAKIGLHTEHPFYKAWANMKARCDIPSSTLYDRYGGRGITYCLEWKEFINFHKDMWESWRSGLSLDRLDNDLNYNINNCAWVTRTYQNRHRSNTKLGPDIAKKILELHNLGSLKRSAIAKQLNVTYRDVYNVTINGQWQ